MMINSYSIFGQRDSRWAAKELGSGTVTPIPTIGDYGCALTGVASICAYFRKNTDPGDLNTKLVNVNGFDNNGNGDYDLIIWPKVTDVYSDISLAFNNSYPFDPADMGAIDSQLSNDTPVIVGVSFLHSRKAIQPTHYVVLYRKNDDGTYQCMDPWFGDEVNFDGRYAVNDMTTSQCILQAISYNGPAAPVITPTPTIVWTDQTLVPINVDSHGYNWSIMELQAIKSSLGDQRVRILSLESQVNDLQTINKEQATSLVGLQDQVNQLNDSLDTAKSALEAAKPTPSDTTTTLPYKNNALFRFLRRWGLI